jgi:hypothetical protein
VRGAAEAARAMAANPSMARYEMSARALSRGRPAAITAPVAFSEARARP